MGLFVLARDCARGHIACPTRRARLATCLSRKPSLYLLMTDEAREAGGCHTASGAGGAPQ